MKFKSMVFLTVSFLPSLTWSFTAKDFGFEQSNKLITDVKAVVNRYEEKFAYEYSVANNQNSVQPMLAFYIETTPPYADAEMFAPVDWQVMGCCITDQWREKATGKQVVSWIIGTNTSFVRAGASLSGFKITIKSLPGIKSFYAKGYTENETPKGEFGEGTEENKAQIELSDLFNNSYSGLTVGPDAVPEPSDAAMLVDRLIVLSQQATKLGWLSKTFSTNQVEKHLKRSKVAIASKNDAMSHSSLDQLKTVLDNEKARGSKNLTDNGFYLLKPNIDYILMRLMGSDAK